MKLEERKPYYFTDKGIAQIESMRNATYMGYWCGKTKDGQWAERPLEVFYQSDPDLDAGHSHYFGLIVNATTDQVLITDAKSCFAEPMSGIVEEGVVYASRYRHDMVITPSGGSVDGGRDYTKTGADPTLVSITVNGDAFEFSEIEDIDDAASLQLDHNNNG